MSEKNDFDGIHYRTETKSPAVFRGLLTVLVLWAGCFIAYYLFSGWSSENEFATKKKAKQEALAGQPQGGAPAAGGHSRLLEAASGVARPCALVGVPYGTDAAFYASTGVPSVVFGPGSIAQAHTADEWVELEQVRKAAEVYYRFVKSFC